MEEIAQRSHEHHLHAEQTYAALREDTLSAKDDAGPICIALDLQQVLFAPNLKHSNVFYQRQLSCYNLGIHFMSDNTACMCLWNESVAGRGASEVCSCLLKVLSLLPPSEKEDLIIWSDACGSQNRNWYTISLWLL